MYNIYIEEKKRINQFSLSNKGKSKIEKRIKLGAIVSGNIEPGLRLRVRR